MSSKDFEYQDLTLPEYPIQAVYLMGSVGSIAYSRKSDLDIWLCHKGNLKKAELDELRLKASAIENWAENLKLETHVFFIDTDRFRLGYGTPISTESCGNIQHYLLLEEFYRTSLWLAGRIPVWWLVPPEQEERYSEYMAYLKEGGYVQENELIDFGGLAQVRPDEFLGGALWHLHKAIDAPHKSLLKLFLMESYAAEYPRIRWLCTQLKSAVYVGSMDVNELDSYILMYRKVEQFLSERNNLKRLDLVRQSFYLNMNELLTVRSAVDVEKLHRRQILEKMVAEWGWESHRIQQLDQRSYWQLNQALKEQQSINHELKESYRTIKRFALEYAEIDRPVGEEIKLLGRKLAAALENRPGKVEKINLDHNYRISPEDFSLLEVSLADGKFGWAIYTGRGNQANAHQEKPLKKSRSLIEILAWLCLNGLYRRGMNVMLENVESALTQAELKSILEALANFLEIHHIEQKSLFEYGQSRCIKAAAVFVNPGIDLESHGDQGSQGDSSHSDALSYGHERTNLIHQIDALFITSWLEILVQPFQGLTGLFGCLTNLVNSSPTELADVEFFCFAPGRARAIGLRLKQLYQDLSDAFRGWNTSSEYILRGGLDFYLFEKHHSIVRFRALANQESLYAELAAPRWVFTSLNFDRYALEDDLLPSIYHRNRAGVIQVFYLHSEEGAKVFILDERGSLYYHLHDPLGPERILKSYALFLGATLQRYILTASEIEYYLVESLGRGGYSVRPAGFQPYPLDNILEIRVFTQEIAGCGTAYSILCNDLEFSSMESGEDVFAQAAAYILQLRHSGEHYPIYITDIDVPLATLGGDTPDQLQSIHFLNYKLKIEQYLNQ